jgi:hypothetical protein
MFAYSRVKYTGSTPGADSSDYTLFSTTTAFPGAGGLQGSGVKSVETSIKNSQAGTLKAYASQDRGTNWYQVREDSVAAAASTAANTFSHDVEEYLDFKLVWTNGGSAQATWYVDISLVDER